MMGRVFILAVFLTLGATASAMAQDARDPRVRIESYIADQIVPVEGHLGYQMMIEFAPDERIENVSIGDSLGWQVTPNRAATLLFLKPLDARAATNMTVVTTRRSYAFALSVGRAMRPNDPRLTYSLRFTYPESEPASAQDEALFNFSYTSTGSRDIMPERVFDDGRFTYFQMRDGAPTPAILAQNAAGDEEVVNSQVRGGYTVVDQIADGFVLRYGRERAVVRRDGAESETRAQPRRTRPGRAR